MIVTQGNSTMVDHTDYNLSADQAADRLHNEQAVLASEFPDLTEEELCNAYPEQVVLSPGDFYGLRKKEILEHLRAYERFAVYP